MSKVRIYAKFAWVYTTSLFLPTAVITPRIQAVVKEYEEMKQREASGT